MIEALLRQFVVSHNSAYGALREVDESLIDYFTVLRIAHAIAKVLAAKHATDIPGIAHEGYAWGHPLTYELIRGRINQVTGIDCGPLPAS
ncbi:MAG: hypothetical protein O3C10_09470 [Chloroflexi bacterium]|nr:hypothetical protein [Chloroflexota bacterium]